MGKSSLLALCNSLSFMQNKKSGGVVRDSFMALGVLACSLVSLEINTQMFLCSLKFFHRFFLISMPVVESTS